MADAMSTSAQLARVTEERDEALGAFALAEELRLKAVADRDQMAENGQMWHAEWLTAREEIDRLRAELAGAARNGWIVARDGGRDCIDCDQEIRRGEAYQLMPGVDNLRHLRCPRPTPHLNTVKAERDEARALLTKFLTNGIEHALTQLDNYLLTVEDAWYCAPCAWTSNDPRSHPDHALTPVRVTITHRQTPEE